jgi:RNA polymerase sporulation-specific sigma factor
MESVMQSDEALVSRAARGEEDSLDELFARYRGIIKTKANLYRIAGGDRDDLMQEGMIGLFKAVNSYDSGKGASFATYAEMCINNAMLSLVRSDGRKKNSPLNTSVSIHAGDGEGGEGREIADLSSPSPEDAVVLRERMERLQSDIESAFSKFEREVWSLFVEGKSYAQIAEKTDRTVKSVDNAVQRMKKKARAILD